MAVPHLKVVASAKRPVIEIAGVSKTYRTQDGLAHRAVLGVAADPRTGVLWAATMGGLSRFSAGRFDVPAAA